MSLFHILLITLRSPYNPKDFFSRFVFTCLVSFSASLFPTANATLNAPIFLANDVQMPPPLLLSLQVHPLVRSPREKDGSENEVIRVCLLQIPLVNTVRNAVVSILSTSSIVSVRICVRLCRLFPLSRLADNSRFPLESFNSRR